MPTLCFVLMPFGVKTDGNKKEIDFDRDHVNKMLGIVTPRPLSRSKFEKVSQNTQHQLFCYTLSPSAIDLSRGLANIVRSGLAFSSRSCTTITTMMI